MRILKGCAAGGPNLLDENLAQLKGKGSTLAPGPRKNPFRPFAEYPKASTRSDENPPAPTLFSKHLLYTYTLAFQCVVNIGVRGSEMIRTRVVEAGALDVVVHVLERYLEEVERRKAKAELEYRGREVVLGAMVQPVSRPLLAQLQVSGSDSDLSLLVPTRVSTPISSMDEGSVDESASSSGQEGEAEESLLAQATRQQPMGSKPTSMEIEEEQVARSPTIDLDGDVTMEESTPLASLRPHLESSPIPPSPLPSASHDTGLQYRDEDVLLSLQLLAYLSKYPHVRSVFHSPADECASHADTSAEVAHDHAQCGLVCNVEAVPRRATSSSTLPPSNSPTLSSNVFSLVESFTHRPPSSDRFASRHSNEVQYWAGVIMRNACRKDESRGGIRQCANMQCGVWEKFPREFAKCRRCRKAKYCSKSCQSEAWSVGHRYWCSKAVAREGEPAGREEENVATTSSTIVPSSSRSIPVPSAGPARQPRLARPSHHAHLASRPSTANSVDTEEDEDELGPPLASSLASGSRTRTPHRHSNPALPRGLEAFATINQTVPGPEEAMDENEVAQEMMVGDGRVFG